MEKIINITLGGRNIAIEDTAYDKVQAYIVSLREYFKNEEGRDEIVADIEARFGELMYDKIRKGAAHISDADVEEMIATMGRPEDFDATQTGQGYAPNFTFSEKRRLYRDANNKVLGGVCSGIANWLNIDPTVVRVLFAIVSFGGFGTGVLIYIALWIFLPARGMDIYKGKRMFRDPDNKWIGGVAGGMGAYFNTNPRTFRFIFALPLLFSFFNGIFNGMGFLGGSDVFFGGLTGSFVFIYIVLWIVLPEALTPYQKMEMRGHNVDVNAIKQNVQSTMGDFGERMKKWGKEVEDSASRLSQKAGGFAQTRGKEFGREFKYAAQQSSRGLGYVIAMIFKAIFVIFGGIIAVSLLVAFVAVLFSGFAWAPVNNFLWTSDTQQMLGWGTLLLFVGAPIVGLVVWLVRRVFTIHTPGNYLNWTFGGLWAIGWVCLMFFLASITSDFKRYETFEQPVTVQQPSNGKMIFTVSQPELFSRGSFGWTDDDAELEGFSVSDDTLMVSAVRLDFEKSKDSLYHVTIIKESLGKTDGDALSRATQIKYAISSKDSVLDLAPGFSVSKASKYRGQNVTVLVAVPVGKKINIDATVFSKLNDIKLEFNTDRKRATNMRRTNHSMRRYRANVDYTMQSDGSLKSDDDKEETITNEKNAGVDENYRWDGGRGGSDTLRNTGPVQPQSATSPSADTASDYRYNAPASQKATKEEIARELEKKQKEIEALKKKLEEQ